eukprot:Rmarinus@m.17323
MADPARAATGALTLQWTFGMNREILNHVVNLNDETRKAFFYVAGHTAIIFDRGTGAQKLLQGHCNGISAVSCSKDRRWIVTADSGPDSMMVIWDSKTGAPVKTIFSPHPLGVSSIDMSNDSMYLATLSTYVDGEGQTIALWDWTSDSTEPLHSAAVTAMDVQTCIRFNPADGHEIVTNGAERVIFWRWDQKRFKFYSPPIRQSDFNQSIGAFTQSQFFPGTSQAMAGTRDGDLVVFDESIIHDSDTIGPHDRKAVKIVRLHNQAIKFLGLVGSYVVTGGVDGHVRFFDYKLRTVGWFDRLGQGPVTSIAFPPSDIGEGYAGDHDDFNIEEFYVATSRATVLVSSSQKHDMLDEDPQAQGEVVLVGSDSRINALSVHPSHHEVATALASGTVSVWDYETKERVLTKKFEKTSATSCTYAPDVSILAVGFTNGAIRLLIPDTLEVKQSFRHSRSAISHICFSRDNNMMAVADYDRCVSLFRYTENEERDGQPLEWCYIGRYQSHLKRIVSLTFNNFEGSGPELQLFSLGEDWRLVEYDLIASSIRKGVALKSTTRVEQLHIPTSMMMHPSSLGGKGMPEPTLVIANSGDKFKTFSSTSKMCRRTVMAPTFSGPLTQLRLVPHQPDEGGPALLSSNATYMAYATRDKVVGLVRFPLEGNPNMCMGLIAHAKEVSDMVVAFDGEYMITAGGNDCTVNLWKLQPQMVEAQGKLGGDGVDPFLTLLEGGKGGAFHEEIIDYAYYAQLRAQGEDTATDRIVHQHIPVEQVPALLQALGFYPTQYEVEDILNEIKYSEYHETGEYKTTISFDDFIQLYVNHRPSVGVGQQEVDEAFRLLGAEDLTGLLETRRFQDMIRTYGEGMGDRELGSCVASLLGKQIGIEEALGEAINSQAFAEGVLGFDETYMMGGEED